MEHPRDVTQGRTSYAMIFSFHDTVEGKGFLARVSARGRAVMVYEDDESWWLYGVQPGAIADRGKTPQEAYYSFRSTSTKVLFDFASGTEGYDAFKAQVQAFFNAVDKSDEQRWDEAREALVSGRLTPEQPFDELPRWDADKVQYRVEVERLDRPSRQFSPNENRVDTWILPYGA